MLDVGWLALRQAQEALRNGLLDEAGRILTQPCARSHRRSAGLLTQLARAYVQRGERALQRDDHEAAWRDLVQAEQLGTAEKSCERLRSALVGLGMAELRGLLDTGQVSRADEVLARLRQRGVRSAELRVLGEAVKGWMRARELAGRGEFGPAGQAVEEARRLLPANRELERFQAEVASARAALPEMLGKLLEAADSERWRAVLELAEQVLALAPQHSEARVLRTKAWQAVEPATVAMPPTATAKEEPLESAPRFLLWIDGVGGYLICLGSRLTFGHAALDPRTDIPLVADVSRLHASLFRDGEGYVLEAMRPVQVNGQAVTRALLQPGDRMTLGATCQFQFRLPVPASMTARLDPVSGHRLPLGVDGVLLMAETLVLGGEGTHVDVRDLKQPVVLFRNKGPDGAGLGLKHAGELRVNGEKGTGRRLLPARATVTGDDFSFALEPVIALTGPR